MRLRWKKDPRPTGLLSVCSGPRGYKLHDGEKVYATVSAIGGRGLESLKGWYWVSGWGSGVPHNNTCYNPVDTPEQAKKEAAAFVKEWLKKTGSRQKAISAN